MTKAELLAAIADAPDDATVYIDDGSGILRSQDVTADIFGSHDIIISYKAAAEPDEDDAA